MRPVGVVSKKLIGERKMAYADLVSDDPATRRFGNSPIRSCNFRLACKVIDVSRQGPQIAYALMQAPARGSMHVDETDD